mmetsp:Transcript_4960/g.7992  ORF Transcript_4960/g.7992 Transcript_4960/m.7992 type:complete len:203 (-) Transcript_4960:404-1012(-)
MATLEQVMSLLAWPHMGRPPMRLSTIVAWAAMDSLLRATMSSQAPWERTSRRPLIPPCRQSWCTVASWTSVIRSRSGRGCRQSMRASCCCLRLEPMRPSWRRSSQSTGRRFMGWFTAAVEVRPRCFISSDQGFTWSSTTSCRFRRSSESSRSKVAHHGGRCIRSSTWGTAWSSTRMPRQLRASWRYRDPSMSMRKSSAAWSL